MPPTFTARQGEYLAFIHSHTSRRGFAPSFEEIARHFGTAAPSVHGMIKTLEKLGLLSRLPGVARSLRVLVPGEALPGSDFGARARGASKPVAADVRPPPAAADIAVAAALAVLDRLMPQLPPATLRRSAAKTVDEAAREVHEALGRLGIAAVQATEVAQRLTAEAARWEAEGRGTVVRRREWARR